MAKMNEEARATVILNGQQANATLKEIEASARALNAELRKLTPGSDDFVKKSAQFQDVKKRIGEVRTEINGTASAMSRMADGANKYFQLFTMIGGAVVGAGLAIKGLVQGSADLSDSLSDIQKTTGLSAAEVRILSSELGKINTRTAKSELLELAYVAGKLGYSAKEDVLGFVKAADQIKVALAKDLGGNTEEAVNALGKLTDVFKLKDQFGVEQALLKTGSAINALGAASTASESYLVEFTKRLGGIAPQAGISIQNVLGLAATLDQLGQNAEMSSTAVSQLVVNMFKNSAEYARIAGLEVQSFSLLMRTDANQALILFLEGLMKNKGGLNELAEKFKGLGIDGSRAIGVIGALSNNIGLLRNSQALSNEEFKKATSLTEEFNIRNNDLAGNLEKVGKWFHKLVFNPILTEGLTDIVKTFSRWVEIPLSQTMEDERIKANALAMELTESNISAQERNKLYMELKSLAPTILEGIDKESIAYGRLSENLSKYNDNMINKIILQKKDEDITRAQEAVAYNREKRVQDEMKLRKKMIETVETVKKSPGLSIEANAMEQILLDSKNDLSKKWVKMVTYIEDHKSLNQRLALELNATVINSGFAGWATREKEAVDELQKLLKEKNDLKDLLDSQAGQAGSPPPSSTAVNTPSTTITSNKTDGKEHGQEDAKKQAAYLLDIERQLIEARAQIQKAGLDRELAMEDAQLQEKLLKIKGNTTQETELKELLARATEQKKQEIIQKYADQQTDAAYKSEKTAIDAKIQSFKDTDPDYLAAVLESLRLEMEYTLSNAKLTEEQKRTIRQAYQSKGETAIGKFDERVFSEEFDFSEKLNQLKLKSEIDLAKGKQRIQLEVNAKYASLLNDNLGNEERTNRIRLQMAEELSRRQIELTNETTRRVAGDAVSLAQGAVDALSQVFAMQTEAENQQFRQEEEVNKQKKESLQAQLDAKIISKAQYDAQVSKMDKDLESKRKKMEHDQAVRNKEIAIFNAIISVAQAVASALSAGPGVGIALSIITAALGAIQIGYILSQKVPEAARGRYSVIGEDDNKFYRDVPLVDKPATGLYSTPTLISETGQEIVIDPKTTRNLMINYPHVIEAINFARVPQAATGRYVETLTSPAQAAAPVVDPQLIASIDRLNSLIEQGIPAFISFEHLRETTNRVNQIEAEVSK